MIVRIRFQPGPVKRMPVVVMQPAEASPRTAGGLAGLLTPVAVLSGAFAAWLIAADLELAHAFPISEGPFAHWQTWFAAAAGLQWTAFALNRRKDAAPAPVRVPGSRPPVAQRDSLLRQAG